MEIRSHSKEVDSAYFCISDADLLTPRQSRRIRPVTAIEIKNRVRVRRTRTALHGGNCDLADFQLTPPFGNNILGIRKSEDVCFEILDFQEPERRRSPGSRPVEYPLPNE